MVTVRLLPLAQVTVRYRSCLTDRFRPVPTGPDVGYSSLAAWSAGVVRSSGPVRIRPA
jgi:hypothetical protein